LEKSTMGIGGKSLSYQKGKLKKGRETDGGNEVGCDQKPTRAQKDKLQERVVIGVGAKKKNRRSSHS